ncbi:hypothetical protein [Paractinoplanes durhamensis]|uniref:hypothetical protein n=1 Tax=Paractinoplanes durhamensis TaxID=113563 RepID=UPI003629C31A
MNRTVAAPGSPGTGPAAISAAMIMPLADCQIAGQEPGSSAVTSGRVRAEPR